MADPSFRDQMMQRLTETGMTVAELSRRSGVSKDAIYKLRRRDTASTNADKAAALAKVLGLDYSEEPRVPMHLGDGEVARAGMIVIPRHEVSASAGHGALVSGEEIVERLAFPPNYIHHITTSPAHYLKIISVVGDSMSPTLAAKDIVMVDTSKDSLSYEAIFVLRLESEDALLVKRIGRATDRRQVTLVSDNPRWPPVVVERDDVKVIGKVVWAGVKYD